MPSSAPHRPPVACSRLEQRRLLGGEGCLRPGHAEVIAEGDALGLHRLHHVLPEARVQLRGREVGPFGEVGADQVAWRIGLRDDVEGQAQPDVRVAALELPALPRVVEEGEVAALAVALLAEPRRGQDPRWGRQMGRESRSGRSAVRDAMTG